MALIRLVLCACLFQLISAKGSESRVECTPELMTVTVPLDGNRKLSYLDQMKDYTPCSPILEDNVAIFRLDLVEPHRCGVTRVLNKITGKRVFYHKITIEDRDGGRESLSVRCVVVPEKLQDVRLVRLPGDPHAIARRAVELPAGFQEPELLEITTSYTIHAPEPQLGVQVIQDNKKVSGEISVHPGAQLSMEIFLDNSSAPVYGLMLGYMQVTDTKTQQETIIFNGCSVDSYLFDNFLTTDGDKLTAKFRAFKFPDTTYVQFRGTVTVCLDKCQGVQCSNGVTGYGRRKRAVDSSGDPNKVFEVSLTTFIKVDYLDGDKEPEDVFALLKNLKVANQMLEGKDDNQATVHERTKSEISVHPGAQLSMEIFLDNSSAPVYGLMLGYMQVTDTKTQQETIIFNGCSVDSYLFDNFLTTDGDKLTAKFRAFKFPDTTYVQFRGTVTVCLDKCQGVQCSNGVTGYGRRKRAVDSSGDPNKVFEVSLTTFIKVDYLDGDKEPEDVFALLKNLKVANQMLEGKDDNQATVHERTKSELKLENPVNAASNIRYSLLICITMLIGRLFI